MGSRTYMQKERLLLEGEGPAMEARSKTYRGIGGVYTNNAHWAAIVSIGGNDDVNVFDNTLEGLVKIFWFKLELEKGTVHLVHENNWTNSFGDGLTQYSLSLDADT